MKITAAIAFFILLIPALPASSIFADDWAKLENALREGGVITGNSSEPAHTETTKLEGGGTKTVTTNADGSRTVAIEGRTTSEPADHTMNFDKDGIVTSESKVYSDGSTSNSHTNADGTRVSHDTTAEGMQVGTVFGADGSSITTSSGGGSEPTETRKSADGTMTTTVNHPDGTKTQTTNTSNGERTTTEIGANGQTQSTNVNHTDGTNTRTEYKDGKPARGTRMSSGGYPRPIGEIVYDDKGVKLREVIKDRWGKIVEVIYFNPDGTENRRSRDPNGPKGVDAFGDSFSMGGTQRMDSRDSQHEIGNNQHGEHHDYGAQHDY